MQEAQEHSSSEDSLEEEDLEENAKREFNENLAER